MRRALSFLVSFGLSCSPAPAPAPQTVSLPSPPPQETAPRPVAVKEPPPSLGALSSFATARIEAARAQAKLERARYAAGAVSTRDMLDSERTVFVAQREANLAFDDLVAAARVYYDAMNALEAQIEDRFKAGIVTEADVQLARYRVAEARFWLEQAKVRAL